MGISVCLVRAETISTTPKNVLNSPKNLINKMSEKSSGKNEGIFLETFFISGQIQWAYY